MATERLDNLLFYNTPELKKDLGVLLCLYFQALTQKGLLNAFSYSKNLS